jgi:hypothetical protein
MILLDIHNKSLLSEYKLSSYFLHLFSYSAPSHPALYMLLPEMVGAQWITREEKESMAYRHAQKFFINLAFYTGVA